jgi:hypothetical protein
MTTKEVTPRHEEALAKLKAHGDWRTARWHNIKKHILLDLVSAGLARYRQPMIGVDVIEFCSMEVK